MSRRGGYAGLDLAFGDEVITRDGFVEHLYSEIFRRRNAERNLVVNDQIAMGWGNTEGPKIPADWRTRMGPDTEGARAAWRKSHKDYGWAGRRREQTGT